MPHERNNMKGITIAILSLSLLTVMAGAAVAPALGIIKKYFSDEPDVLVQMIISTPAIFIVLTNMIFPRLCKRFGARSILIIGLFIYTFGGSIAGLFSNIYLVLAARALVGIGVGIIMPMSTGLISFYFHRDKQEKMMGYSSAMNQLGGVVATLLAGILATVSWRISFLVYLMGLFCIIFCIVFMPKIKLHDEREGHKVKGRMHLFREYAVFVIAIFILMMTFFIYPSNFAMETGKNGIISHGGITVIMAAMDLVALFGGLAFLHLKNGLGKWTKFVAPLSFLVGYIILLLSSGVLLTVTGSLFVGFANGAGIPLIIAAASKRAGKTAATTVMPMISGALYLAQFVTPVVTSLVAKVFGGLDITHLPYATAIWLSILLILCSCNKKLN